MGNDLIEPGQLISLYLELEPSTDVDLEVAAEAAIEWSQTLKAAARAVNPDFEYRVNLIATEKGSNKWLAKIERLPINQNALTLKQRWENTPFIIRAAISLASVLVVTAKPTYDAYFPDDGLTETQKVEFKEIVDKAISDSSVQSHKKTMYRKTQRDKNISGVGGGVPDGPNWKPSEIVPRTRFAEGDGLFELQR